MTLSPTISRWSSLVFFSVILHLSHADLFPLSKKTSSRFPSVFSAMHSVSPIYCFWSNRILSVQPKHTTRCHRFHNRKNSLPLILCFFWSSSTQWILSSRSITFLSLLYVVTQGSNPFTTNSRGRERDYIFIKPFLEIDVKGGERDHIKAYHLERDHIREYHFHRGRERSPGGENTQVESISQGSQMLGVQEERCPHVFLRGETCSYDLLCLFALAYISSKH